MSPKALALQIRKQWDIPGLITDLRKEKWHQTEPGRIDRMHWIGSYHTIEDLAKDAYPEKEWEEAAADEVVGADELIDDYLTALSDVLIEATGGELRQEHVYTTMENDEVFIGQYEDIPADALRAMGFEIGGTQLGFAFPWSGAERGL